MKTWFITGASGGLATCIIQQLLERGDRVAATIRRPGVLDDLQAQYGAQLWQANLDLTNPQQISEVVTQAFNELGTIDVLVNNAAYALYGGVEEASDEQIEQQFITNVFGSLRTARTFLPFFREQDGGQIVQISSMAGHYSTPAMGLYSSTKRAVEGAFEALAQEVAPFNIKTIIVQPGGIRTNFVAGNGVFGEPLAAYQDTETSKVVSMMKGEVPGMDANLLKKMVIGDPDKMAHQIIKRVDLGDGPLRLALNSDAYQKIRASLVEKLAALDAQKEVAYATDADDI
ncbi:NAD(P)-dependent dehydrogenase (short-subunit alcohol dehydrogenase family) [Enterococcus sp. PF1-24]|uniref:SDR family oxidoreductase n=1 Tax=unclassified Enterococcus TaxID=2608891 RepID=UPI0024761CAF|nr:MULTISPECIES: SDR family oxidoreductase [unclassified Enterococcus]MDH6364800.1 NAD(P)-dependent dehydrogenase (short-subunit alcohol dehydrogenase family) [Enterococcus sp. PFB1-1]MDH6401855.1 NAD(P)-dependent dehydrogenase (short-subunit alcohol dehydrogenase family) [Enterococcus sp. PF1-24]